MKTQSPSSLANVALLLMQHKFCNSKSQYGLLVYLLVDGDANKFHFDSFKWVQQTGQRPEINPTVLGGYTHTSLHDMCGIIFPSANGGLQAFWPSNFSVSWAHTSTN
jgi:hypothetical protein